jgi:hypothetical protein
MNAFKDVFNGLEITQNENSLFNRMAEFVTNIGLNFVTPHESFDSIESKQELISILIYKLDVFASNL